MITIRNFQLDSFTQAYLVAALWSSYDESTPAGGEPMGVNYSLEDISIETLQKAIDDCAKFQSENAEYIISENCNYKGCTVKEYAGHDFYLTRVGSGVSFLDGYWIEPAATKLYNAAQSFKHLDLYIGDDKKIYSI